MPCNGHAASLGEAPRRVPEPGFSTSVLAARLPLVFESNEGQSDALVRFLARGPGYTVFLTPQEAVLCLAKPGQSAPRRGRTPAAQEPAVLRLRLSGSNPRAMADGAEPASARISHLTGNDPTAWRRNVAVWGSARFTEVYPGIDVVYHGRQGRLEFDFIVRPGADPAAIGLEVQGAEQLFLDARGDLRAGVAGVEAHWEKPVAWQEIDGHRQDVACEFDLRSGGEVRFRLGTYDPRRELIIDPLLVYASYLGGGLQDEIYGVAVDGQGNVYLTGRTLSANFPVTNAVQAMLRLNGDAFVTKLNSNGSALVYSTFLGGGGVDIGFGIAVDSAGQAFVTGETDSQNFPTQSAFQPALAQPGVPDAFLAKLSASGASLLYATYFGGSGAQSAAGVAVDAAGAAYIAGRTSPQMDFPARHPFQAGPGGGFEDAFVAKFNPLVSGSSSLVYASWLGGMEDELANGIAVDASGRAHVTGEAFYSNPMTDFPLTNAVQPIYAGGGSDAFVARVSSQGSNLLFSTFLGGTNEDAGAGIAVDALGGIHVAGRTSSPDFPTTNAAQSMIGGGPLMAGTDAFYARFNAAGSALLYSSFLGGLLDDEATGLALDTNGSVHLAGFTISFNFPVKEADWQPAIGGNVDAFLATFYPSVSGPDSLLLSSYLGGSDMDEAHAIAVDARGFCHVAGRTDSAADFPITGAAWQSTYGGGFTDGFLARVSHLPRLRIQPAGSQILLSWPVLPPGFFLEHRSNLNSGAWMTVTNSLTSTNGENTLLLAPPQSPAFYRLRRN
jgi:hypothetical protein